MYYLNAIGLGVLVPLLAYTIVRTLNSYFSYRARNLSATLRDAVSAKLQAIISTADAPQEARDFSAHLLNVVGDSDEMRDRSEWFVACQNETESDDDVDDAEIDDFKKRVGAEYVDRFERIFPMLTTACLLLHPTLGRMFYRTISRTAAASAISQRALQQAEMSVRNNRKTQKVHIVSVPMPLLFQGSRRRDERLWECEAA